LVTWQEFVVIAEGMFFALILPTKNTGQRGLFCFSRCPDSFFCDMGHVRTEKRKRNLPGYYTL
jgi:hypothetical protein